MSWSPTLFFGSGPLRPPPVPCTEKTIEREVGRAKDLSALRYKLQCHYNSLTVVTYFWQFSTPMLHRYKISDSSNLAPAQTQTSHTLKHLYISHLFQMLVVIVFYLCLLAWKVCLKQILNQEYKVQIFMPNQCIKIFHCPPSAIL
jgi:hypothetical protein